MNWCARTPLFLRCAGGRLVCNRPGMPPQSAADSDAAASPRAPLRRFGRFQLLGLLGKSARTMAWRVHDEAAGGQLALLLPRVVPHGEGGVDRWLQRARKAARLDHPHLAVPVEVDVHEGWPYAAYAIGDTVSLLDHIGDTGLGATETATLAGELLTALAFAHDAGAAHRDLQAFCVLVGDRGTVRLMGLDLSCLESEQHGVIDTQSLQAQRAAAAADVLQVGVLLHHLLTGQPALDEPDSGKVAERLPPLGREMLRLPFVTPRPIPDTLRAIVNRATDRQERQRYRSARTLVRALEGWLQVEGSSQTGPLALLLDRIRSVGVLPGSPGAAQRIARLSLMEKGRTDEMAELLLEDPALSFELLRAVNTAQVRGTQVSGNGPVLTVRRAIAMIGLEGVRRVALALRSWPGPLDEANARELQRLMDRTRHAARVAVAIRSPGYDAEVVYLVTLLQNLGRLVVQYHFADEAQQIERLMQSVPKPEGGEDHGMSEQAASMAVLGVDLETIGPAVARWWGLDDSVLHMLRRHSLTGIVHNPENDDERIRLIASGANEAVDTLHLPARRQQAAQQAVVQRYGRALALSLRDLQAALQAPASSLGVLGGIGDGWPRQAPDDEASSS